MSLSNTFQRFRALLSRAGLVHARIEREYRQKRPDWVKLLRLKKLRLAIKDQLMRIARTSGAQLEPGDLERAVVRVASRVQRQQR
jgi:hypothetical protein